MHKVLPSGTRSIFQGFRILLPLSLSPPLTVCFELALQVASVVAIVMGAWVLSERGQLVRDAASFFLDPSAMLCLLGALTFLVAVCGCLGALRENIRLLKAVGI